MKPGDRRQAPYGRVRVLGRGEHGVLCRYLDGPFQGREARIPKEWLRGREEPRGEEAGR